MKRLVTYTLILVGIVSLIYFDLNRGPSQVQLNSIAEYKSCLISSNKILINDVYEEMSDADMKAICIYKNDVFRKTDYYENALPNIKAEVCANQKPYNRDVLKDKNHTTYLRVYDSGLRIPPIHETDAFWRQYNADERHAYWSEKYRSTGQVFICGI